MFGIDDVAEGAAVGVGAVAIGAVAIVGGRRAKPLAKRALIGYMGLAHRVRGAVAEAAERVQDLYAEARYEYESELDGVSAGQEAAPEAGAAPEAAAGAEGEQPAKRAARTRETPAIPAPEPG